MSVNPFLLPFDRLPSSLPIFPLANAVVMPGCQLPLNIFEPRYLNLVFDALGAERMIGMVQPEAKLPPSKTTAIYRTGTAGRIVSFSETQDGRLLIVLDGVCRFDIEAEIATTRGYRRVIPDWSRFRTDFEFAADGGSDRARLHALLQDYFAKKDLETNWRTIEQMGLTLLINMLIGQLPIAAPERQALIEAVTVEERLTKLVGLLEMELAGNLMTDGQRH